MAIRPNPKPLQQQHYKELKGLRRAVTSRRRKDSLLSVRLASKTFPQRRFAAAAVKRLQQQQRQYYRKLRTIAAAAEKIIAAAAAAL